MLHRFDRAVSTAKPELNQTEATGDELVNPHRNTNRVKGAVLACNPKRGFH